MARISSIGTYHPAKIVDNDFFAAADSSQQGIEKYFTGMKERRHADPIDESGIFMGVRAALDALNKADIDPASIDLIIGCVVPNQHLCPEDLNLVANGAGCKNAVVYPLHSACSSFLSCLNVADAMIASGRINRVMIVNSNHWVGPMADHDSDTFPIAGDGAAATIVENGGDSFLDIEEISCNDEDIFHSMQLKNPLFTGKKEIFKITQIESVDNERLVSKPINVARTLLDRQTLAPDYFIAHQAGVGMLKHWMDILELDESKLRHTFPLYGNMMSTNIPVTMNHYIESGEIKRGDTLLLFSPAAGAHYISILWRY
ncbi:MAG: hypothetical protein COA99_14040 [Moraxellaceae bacterium]|nr:MAG: hypothetical protein COA99_14040 [Moraxellaceae bacterium]